MINFLHNKTGGYRLVRWLLSILSFFVARAAWALDTGIDATASFAGLKPASGDTPKIPQVIGGILGAVLALLGVIALVLIIYGGFLWMTASGNEEQIKKAKSVLSSSIIGLAIIVSAYIIVNYVVSNILTAAGVS